MNSQNEKVAKDRYAALNRMKYTEAFIYEVLRLHPSVPIDIKYAVNKDILPDGTVVGCCFVVALLLLCCCFVVVE